MTTSSWGAFAVVILQELQRQEGLVSMPIDSTFAGGAVILGIVVGFVLGHPPSPAADADAARIPDFASDPSISSGRARDHAERWPQPGTAMDVQTRGLRNAAGIAVTSYPTASQTAAERVEEQKSEAKKQFATDAKRPASRPDALDSFAKRDGLRLHRFA
jgi:hypothetical protein